MKCVFFIILLFSLSSCDGQNKKSKTIISVNKDRTHQSIKKDTMKQFILDKYKDWEFDNSYTSSTNERKFLKKGNERVEIYSLSDGIQVRLRKFNSPYEKIEGYSSSTNSLIAEGTDFYGLPIEKSIEYNEKGQILKEIDYEKPFKFTIKELIEKIKKEYHVNLEDRSQGGNVGRNGENGNFYYEVELASKENPQMINYILIDGVTGETKFKTHYYMKGNTTPPFDQYLETLKKK